SMMRAEANIPAFKTFVGLLISASTVMVRDAGSSAGLMAVTLPENSLPGNAATVAITVEPIRACAVLTSGNCNFSFSGFDLMSVAIFDCVVTYSPTATGRSLMKPANGAVITVSATALRAMATCALTDSKAARAVAMP